MAYRIKLRRSKRIAYFIGGLAVLVLSFLSTLFLLDHGLLSPSHSVLIAERRFDYRDGAVGKLWLGTGWSVPDSLGVWTDGERAEMEIKLGERTRRVELLIKTAAYVGTPRRKSQEVSVELAGRTVATWQYSDENEGYRILDIGPDDIKNGSVKLVFLPHDPQSPKDLGISVDSRRIALRLIYLMVREFE